MNDNKIKSTNKLTIIGGFLIVLFLLGCLMIIAITQILKNETQITEVNEELDNVGHAFIMRDAANNRALLLYRMVQTDDSFLQNELYNEFIYHASNFISSHNIIKNQLHYQKDKEQLEITRKVISVGGKIQVATAKDIIEGKTEKAHTVLADKIIPVQLAVREKITQLSQSFQDNADNYLIAISSQNAQSILFIKIIGVIAISLGLFITSYVTRRVTKSEHAFIQQQCAAEDANKAKSVFLATMSHEIRSPLSAIIGFSDLMRKSNVTPEKSNTGLESIHRNSVHLLHLINDILDITKIEAGQLDIEHLFVSTFKIVDELKSDMDKSVNESGLKFNINYAFPLPEMIQTDPVRLKQILFNLISNAIKFTDTGEINLNISCSKDKNKLRFEISDTGIGLSEQQQHKIFESFTQADSSTTRKYGGSGLGLKICKQLTKQLGGDITVESTLGRGSTFSFEINTGNIPNDNLIYSLDSVIDYANISDYSKSEKLSGNILLAEDTVDNQNLIEIYVTDIGASIIIVENGAEAVKRCTTQKFDLILMDMQMPIMDGIQATKKIRQTDSTTPIVALTANALKSDADKCLNAGANEFITKPIDITRFHEILKKYLSTTKD